jgi:hypothetical protein
VVAGAVGNGVEQADIADDVLFVVFNPTAGAEASGIGVPPEWKKASLQAQSREHGFRLETVMPGKYSNVTLPNGTRLDLAPVREAATREDWDSVDTEKADVNLRTAINALGLDEAQSQAIYDAIHDNARPDGYGRDELFNLAKVWARAEKGGDIPNRLVISAHHTSHWYGDDNHGDVSEGAFSALAKVMPKAAKQVAHVGLFACFTAGEARVNELRSDFPNLQSAWFYEGISAGAGNGSVFHLQQWNLATLGQKTFEEALRTLDTTYKGFRGQASASWDIKSGYHGDEFNRDITTLQADIDARKADYAKYFSGETVLPLETAVGPVREYYAALQSLSMHPALPRNERVELDGEIAKAIRLVFYRKMIRPKLSEHRQSLLDGAATALGLPKRNFSQPTEGNVRKQDLEYISQFTTAAAGNSSNDVKNACRLLEGLRDLDPAVIPNDWV